MKEIKSVLLDNSFCIRLLKKDDPFHENALEYFKYFIENKIEMYLSTIVISEYAVGDDPDNLLALKTFKLLEFDYSDAKIAGRFFSELKDNQELRANEQRSVIINDIKLFAQIKNRNIDAYITKDKKSKTKFIDPLSLTQGLSVEFVDLSIPLNQYLGKLF